ncbi:MAG: esterase-like activity of phytase family protein, partial [Pseudomonadota bacterium]
RLAADGALFWASERDAPKGGAPFLSRIAPPPPAAGAGGVGVPAARAEETLRIPAPGYYAPRFEGETRVAGVRENLGFESLTIAPDGRLVAANEGPLVQDAEKPSLAAGAPARVLLLEPDGTPVREHLYPVDPLPARPIPADGFATSGLVEMLSDPAGGGLLALERSFAVGQGHVVKLYRTDFAGAQDVLGRESAADVPPGAQMRKRLLHTIQAGAHVDYVDNIEAITFGPEIAGDRTLVLISDNNFNPRQATQVLAYRLKE